MERGEILYDLDRLGGLEEGIFQERPNRFVALAELGGKVHRVHVADTGRLEEILTPGRPLLLLPNRAGMKTDYTLIAARMEEGWVLVNTRLHVPIAEEAIRRGVLGWKPKTLRREVSYAHSRFDYLADESFVELKGCSLVEEGICLFPNAPTTRGQRHLRELMRARRERYGAILLVLGLRRCRCFRPHARQDPIFADLFAKAMEEGVEFRGFFIRIEGREVCYDGELSLCDVSVSL